MEKFTILSTEGNPDVLINAMKKLSVLGLLDKEGQESLITAAAQGAGRTITYEEAARVVNWALETMVSASMLEAVLAGSIDIDPSGSELSFGLTPQGEKNVEDSMTQAVQENTFGE